MIKKPNKAESKKIRQAANRKDAFINRRHTLFATGIATGAVLPLLWVIQSKVMFLPQI